MFAKPQNYQNWKEFIAALKTITNHSKGQKITRYLIKQKSELSTDPPPYRIGAAVQERKRVREFEEINTCWYRTGGQCTDSSLHPLLISLLSPSSLLPIPHSLFHCPYSCTAEGILMKYVLSFFFYICSLRGSQCDASLRGLCWW